MFGDKVWSRLEVGQRTASNPWASQENLGMKHHVLKPWVFFFPGERGENAAFLDATLGIGVGDSESTTV